MTSQIPATFLISDQPQAPLEITFRHDALRMAVVDRDQFSPDVAQRWETTGIYLLFGPPEDDIPGRFSVYVGKAAPGWIADRIRDHVRRREGWVRVLLVTRTTDEGFNSTDVGWLEGRLHQLLGSASDAELLNSTTPGDNTISDWDRNALERVVTLVKAVMRVLGYRPDPPTTPVVELPVASATDRNAGFDVNRLHALVGLVKAGEWTSYGDVAEAIGSHARGIGSHIRACGANVPEWRVMNRWGQIVPGFSWNHPDNRGRDPIEVLSEEGLRFNEDGRADSALRVSAEELLRRSLTA